MSASLLHARPGVLWAPAVLTACFAVTWSIPSDLRGSEFSPSGEGGWFIRGDADQSGILEITDAIFTLNQDLMLEHRYVGDGLALASNGRWNGCLSPGLKLAGPAPTTGSPFTALWTPFDGAGNGYVGGSLAAPAQPAR